MVKSIILVVQIMINGAWVSGDDLDGWTSVQMPDMATCIRAMNRGNHRMPPATVEDVLFSCEERESRGVVR